MCAEVVLVECGGGVVVVLLLLLLLLLLLSKSEGMPKACWHSSLYAFVQQKVVEIDLLV